MLSFPHLQGKFSNTCHGPAPSSSLHCSREAGGRVGEGGVGVRGGGWGGVRMEEGGRGEGNLHCSRDTDCSVNRCPVMMSGVVLL